MTFKFHDVIFLFAHTIQIYIIVKFIKNIFYKCSNFVKNNKNYRFELESIRVTIFSVWIIFKISI